MKAKRLLVLTLMTFCATSAWAYNFSAVAPSGQTLYYNIVDGHAEVVRPGTGAIYYKYVAGNLIIPDSVTYNDNRYAVTAIASSNYANGGTFYNCSGLTSVIIPSSVTSIGNYAFCGCSGLTSVTIPSSVTSIGSDAFYNCRGLTSVTIPDGVTLIGDDAFSQCSGLTSVTIPSSVTSIGSDAFYNCSGLTSVTIPDGVTSIGSSAFSGCSSLTSVTIPSSVTSIGSYAFSGCSGLISVTIPDGVTSIGYCAFASCSSLTSVTISDGVTSIGESAFDGCSSLTSVTIPSSVTSIGLFAFSGCSGLTSVTIPSSVTSIDSFAFANVRHIEYYGSATGSPWDAISMNGVTEGDFVFSDTTKHYLVAYSGAGGDVTIPSTVDTIGSSAFSGCRGLTSVTIPSSVTSIGSGAFSGCSGLTSVTIPSSVTSIGWYAFSDCSSLTSVTIPSSVTSIGDRAFSQCSGLTSVTIPSSVTSIGSYAFDNVRHIKYYGSATGSPWGAITMNGVTKGDFVYSDTTKHYLVAYSGAGGDVTIPSTVDTIGSSAFYGCSGLTSVTIPSSVTSIGWYAFSDCSSLTSVTIPSSVTSIGSDAFEGCSGLTLITIPSSVTSIGSGAFSGCSNLTSVTIPSSVTSIGSSAFSGCSSLTSVTIPEGVTSIGQYTFYGCSGLTSVTIPSSVTSMGYNAFSGCSGLTVMWMKPATPPTLENQSSINDGIIDLVVPRNSYTVYVNVDDNYTRHRIYRDTVCITVNVNDPARGSVIGYDSVCPYPAYLDTITVMAISNHGYHFNRWENNDTCSVRRLTNITGDVFLTAYFDKNKYTIYANADTSIHGYINAPAQSNYLDEAAITAHAYHGYHFTHWQDGNTDNPRTFVLTQDTHFVAYYDKNVYTLTFQSDNSDMGIVDTTSVSSEYLDTTMLIYATATTHYHFIRWSDNNTENPRRFVFDNNQTYTAYFDKNKYAVNAQCGISIHGYTNAPAQGNYLDEVSLSAHANHGYHFTHWQDGNADNPRTFVLTQDTQFVAYYDKNVYTLTFQSNNSDMGIVDTTSVSSEYLDTTMLIYATATTHYHFVRWSDNNTENPRRFVFDDNRTYTAYFAIDEHTVSVQADNLAHGMVSGAGTREYGQPITVSATPYSGYQFAHWSDGSTYNPYTFAVLEDKSLTAIFIADGEPWQDTVVVYDTAYITLHDTTYINVPVHDTTYINVPVHDTAYITLHDTTYINVPVHDTTYINVPVHDTTYINVPVHDTTYINVPVHDTTYINVPVHDTTYINVPVHDTTYITATDTLTMTQYDTIINTVYDTVNNYVHDTVMVTDTLWLTQVDTVWLHDTVIVHDTVYITQEGIGDVDALNAKVYSSQGQIVVEGANGNMVALYDVNGRMLATKRDEYAPLRFDAPVSGTYMIKTGNHPARKVVVIR